MPPSQTGGIFLIKDFFNDKSYKNDDGEQYNPHNDKFHIPNF
jgi:hypothetical protein